MQIWEMGNHRVSPLNMKPRKWLYTYTVKPLYSRQPWDKYKCPDYRGALISGVNLYIINHSLGQF